MKEVMQQLIEVRNALRDREPSRANSLAITKVEEAMFWHDASKGNAEVIGIFDRP